MAEFVNIEGTLINLDNVVAVETRDNHPEWEGTDWMRVNYVSFKDTRNVRRAYDELCKSSKSTFLDIEPQFDEWALAVTDGSGYAVHSDGVQHKIPYGIHWENYISYLNSGGTSVSQD